MIMKDLRLPADHSPEQLLRKIEKQSGIKAPKWRILRRSIDARKNPVLRIYTIEAVGKEQSFEEQKSLQIPASALKERPLIIGSGPAGLFAAYILAKAGASPILFERGRSVEARQRDILSFQQRGILSPDSNVQFGEGGADRASPKPHQ